MDKDSATKKLEIMEQQQEKEISFTELESQCVLQYMQNKSLINIGVDLGLTPNTVRFYLMNAGQKLHLSGKKKRTKSV